MMKSVKIFVGVMMVVFLTSCAAPLEQASLKNPGWRARGQKLKMVEWGKLKVFLDKGRGCWYNDIWIESREGYLFAMGFKGVFNAREVLSKCRLCPANGRSNSGRGCTPAPDISGARPPGEKYALVVVDHKLQLPCMVKTNKRIYYFRSSEYAKNSFGVFYLAKRHLFYAKMLRKGFCIPFSKFTLPPEKGYIYFSPIKPGDPNPRNWIYVRTKSR